MKISEAKFIKSASEVQNCPPPNLPEYAFIGRSNVGKSSLINMLVSHKNLAKTSQTPGKTQLINHFLVNQSWFLVDLPGYGFAKAPKAEREKWEFMIKEYLTTRSNLICVFVLIDVRHEPQKVDLAFLQDLGENEIPFELIFTKADKVKAAEAQRNMEKFKETMLETWEELPNFFLTSSEKETGRKEVLDNITELNQGFEAPNVW